MAEILVSAERDYRVRITGDWRGDLSPLASNRSKVAIIYSTAMASSMPAMTFANAEVVVIEVPDGETAKTVAVIDYIWRRLAKAGFTRGDLIVGIGGGTVTDLAGFAAATWLRGLDWVAIPTTLAGMVDASVGGKTGINSPAGKNLIGAFHSPLSVLIDTNWLKTLSDRDFAAGLAEVIKCGFIDDPEILSILSDIEIAALRSNSILTSQLIERSIRTKAKVVSNDFKESDLREILNYGHTFGHAIERVSDYSIRHGEAVSIGMVFVAELAHSRELIDGSILDLHRSLLAKLSLPISLSNVPGAGNWAALYAAISLDKKARGSSIRFVALDGVGSCTRIEGVSEEELRSAYEKVLA